MSNSNTEPKPTNGNLILAARGCDYWMLARETERGVMMALEATHGLDARRRAEAAGGTDDPDPLELARRNTVDLAPANVERIARDWAEAVGI